MNPCPPPFPICPGLAGVPGLVCTMATCHSNLFFSCSNTSTWDLSRVALVSAPANRFMTPAAPPAADTAALVSGSTSQGQARNARRVR